MAGNGAGYPKLGPLYVKQTESSGKPSNLPGVLDMIGNLSVTSQFKVSMHLSKFENPITNRLTTQLDLINHLTSTGLLKDEIQATSYDFYCSEASLPGAVLNTAAEAGSRQGVIESFPTHRIYSPVDITFYVDNEFKIIRIFEEWMNFINPIYNGKTGVKYSPNGSSAGQGNFKDKDNFFRLKYPNTYKKTISITKFERDFRIDNPKSNKLKPKINTVTYRLLEAYPDNISAIPVTYQGSEITRANIRFTYSRYVIETSQENP